MFLLNGDKMQKSAYIKLTNSNNPNQYDTNLCKIKKTEVYTYFDTIIIFIKTNNHPQLVLLVPKQKPQFCFSQYSSICHHVKTDNIHKNIFDIARRLMLKP